MATIPGGNVLKFVAVGAPYSPAVSFNPKMNEVFKTDATTLGLLDGLVTSNGVNITVKAGTVFIQQGIICRVTADFTMAIPGGAFPKKVVLNLTNESPGTPVTVTVTSAAVVAPNVLIAQLTPNNSTVVMEELISIRGLRDRIRALELAGGGGGGSVDPREILKYAQYARML